MVYLDRGAADGSFDHPARPRRRLPADPLGRRRRRCILDSFNVTVSGGKTVDIGDEAPRRLVHRDHRHGLHRHQRQRQAGPGRAGRPAVPGGAQGARQLADGPGHQHRRPPTAQRRTTPSGGVPADASGSCSRRSTPATRPPASPTRPTTSRRPTTLLGAAVDLDVLPIIGLAGRIDWGVQPYHGAENGGIAGTVSYDTTRNELDPQFAVTEDYQPGIPGIEVDLYAVVRDDNAGDPVHEADGSCSSAARSSSAETRTPRRPGRRRRGCTARMFDGQRAHRPARAAGLRPGRRPDLRRVADDGLRRPTPTDNDPGRLRPDRQRQLRVRRLEAEPATRRVTRHNPAPRPPSRRCTRRCRTGRTAAAGTGDYLVTVDIPTNPVGGRPMYQVTRRRTSTSSTATPTCPRRTSRPRRARPTTRRRRRPRSPAADQPPSQGNGIISACAGANTRARHRPGVHRRRRQPVRGPGPAARATPSWSRSAAARPVAPNFNLFTAGAAPHPLLGSDASTTWPVQRQAQRQLRRGAGPAARPGRPLRLGRPARRHGATPTSTACTRRSSRRPARTTARCRRVRARTCTASSATTPASPGDLNAELQPAVPHHRDQLPGLARAVHGDRHGPHPGRRVAVAPAPPRSTRSQLRPRPPTTRSSSRSTSRSCAATDTRRARTVTVTGAASAPRGHRGKRGAVDSAVTDAAGRRSARSDRARSGDRHRRLASARPQVTRHRRQRPASTTNGLTLQVLGPTSARGSARDNPRLFQVKRRRSRSAGKHVRRPSRRRCEAARPTIGGAALAGRGLADAPAQRQPDR